LNYVFRIPERAFPDGREAWDYVVADTFSHAALLRGRIANPSDPEPVRISLLKRGGIERLYPTELDPQVLATEFPVERRDIERSTP